MFVATVLLFLSSTIWAHDLLKDAAQNAVSQLPVASASLQQACNTQTQDCSDETFSRVMGGFHGHLLFGQGPFYLSHLPLYAPPHNYQAIYEVEFPEAAENLKKVLKQKLAEGSYATFAPSSNPANRTESSMYLKIPQLTCRARAAGDQVFWGEVHADHFERGGAKLGNAGLIIKRVIYYKELPLSPLPEQPADPQSAAEYIVFGQKGQYFASRVLGKRPGVDQIFPLPSTQANQWQGVVGDLDHVSVKASAEKNRQREFQYQNQSINVSVPSFYTEAGELQ